MVNTVGKKVSEVLRSYTAGFLDADGAIMAPIERHQDKRFKFRIRVIVKFTQRDRDKLDQLKEGFGIGKVVNNGSAYDWVIKDQYHVQWFLKLLLPHIKVKENQALIALQIVGLPKSTQAELLEVASLADTLSSYNVRSKHRRRNNSLMIQETFSRND